MSTLSRSAAQRTTPAGIATRMLGFHNRIPTLALAGAVLFTLLGGILLSILTTSDPLWWQEHFSRLGTFQNLSAAFFNGGLIAAGALVVLFAGRVWRDIARLGRRGGFRGAATVAFLCLAVIGVNLALVGMIPMNTDQVTHDRVAGSMVLGFLGLLFTSPVMLHRLPRRLFVATGLLILWMAVAITLFVAAAINLTFFEVVSSAAMFTWAGIFTSCVVAHGRMETQDECGACGRSLQGSHQAPRRPHRRQGLYRARAKHSLTCPRRGTLERAQA